METLLLDDSLPDEMVIAVQAATICHSDRRPCGATGYSQNLSETKASSRNVITQFGRNISRRYLHSREKFRYSLIRLESGGEINQRQ